MNTKEDCKCPHCGSKHFYLHEGLYYKAIVDENNPNEINCWNKSCEITLVECALCEEDITEISLNPNFRFNF